MPFRRIRSPSHHILCFHKRGHDLWSSCLGQHLDSFLCSTVQGQWDAWDHDGFDLLQA